MSQGKTTHLTDDQMLNAVTLFAQGLNRSEVVAHLIDADDTLQDLEAKQGQTLRNNISNQLRSADPRSTHFAVTKYQAHFEMHQKAALEILKKRYNSVINQTVDFMTLEINTLQNQMQKLDYMLEGAIDTEPKSTVEYIQTLNARNAAAKRILELQEKILERIERITLPKPDTEA